MQFDTSTWMMIAFVVGMGLSIWKLYQFMPTRQLKDDDTTKEAQDELLEFITSVIKESHCDITVDELHQKVVEHEKFDKEHFWRFNPNKLNQLLQLYYIKNPHSNCIKDIHRDLHKDS